MKRIAFVVYRKWAYDICRNIVDFQREHPGFIVQAIITTPTADFEVTQQVGSPQVYIVDGGNNNQIAAILAENNIDVVCYYGWSWLVREPILSRYVCLCLHPSPLPKYRGGSPIQNQIMSGEVESAVSVFRMGQGLDDGDIYKQLPLSLMGTLTEIFNQIKALGTIITQQFILDLIENKVVFAPQQRLEENPPFKRRKPEQSEIVLDKFASLTYQELYNKVRALSDPYPNAFISFPDGTLFIKEIEKCDSVPPRGVILNEGDLAIKFKGLSLYLHLTDGYALISKFRLE